jgi:hypothetical protein
MKYKNVFIQPLGDYLRDSTTRLQPILIVVGFDTKLYKFQVKLILANWFASGGYLRVFIYT